MIQFILNDEIIQTGLPSGTTLLDFIRYEKNLTGTKIGCREGDCGACTILVGDIQNNKLVYSNATSCLMAIGNAHLKHIVTIEGVNMEKQSLVQKSFSDFNATQCGFCTPGFVVSLTGACVSGNVHTAADAIDSMNGNICRCTGYKSIQRAAVFIAENVKPNLNDLLQGAVDQEIIPQYFLTIESRLKKLRASIQPHPIQQNSALRLAGGTDLYVQQHERMVQEQPELMATQDALRFIRKDGNTCTLGAATTVSDMAASPIFKDHFRNLNAWIKLISSTPIRNMATIAGNFVNASPIGDLSVFFLALDAQLLITDGTSERILPLRSFYNGYKKLNWQPGEYIQSISFELPDPESNVNFEKVCKRTHLDIASVNSALHIHVKDGVIQHCSISAGGVSPVPAYLSQSSKMLEGKPLTRLHVQEMLQTVQQEIAPISDARGSATYKRLLLQQLIMAHFNQIFPDLDVYEKY